MVEKNMQMSCSGWLDSTEQDQWAGFNSDFILSPPHQCEYLENTKAMTLFANPMRTMDPCTYEHLLENGFRRSGEYIYRPHCPSCSGCISVRVPVNTFRMSRNMKRIWKRNDDLVVNSLPPKYSEEHFQLYKRYIHSRHKGGSMDYPNPESYPGFFISSWMDTRFYEFRRAGKLLMVAVADHLKRGLSAVYTFFDPEESSDSLGTYGVLWEVEQAKRLEKQWLYLGYWISNSNKMCYKSRFRPLEALQNERWKILDAN